MMRPTRLRTGLVVAIAGAAAVASASPGSASTASRHSRIFAGYAVSKPGLRIKQVTARFVVPTITCDSSVSGVGPSVLVYSHVKPGSGSHVTSGAGLGVACDDGGAVYESVIIVNSSAFNDVKLNAGDVVVVDVRVTSARTTVSLDDTTSGVSKTRTGRGQVASQTFVGDNNVVVDGQRGGLDPFSPTRVSAVVVNGHRLGAESPIRFQWTSQGTTLVSTSALRSGESFSLTYRHAETMAG